MISNLIGYISIRSDAKHFISYFAGKSIESMSNNESNTATFRNFI